MEGPRHLQFNAERVKAETAGRRISGSATNHGNISPKEDQTEHICTTPTTTTDPTSHSREGREEGRGPKAIELHLRT